MRIILNCLECTIWKNNSCDDLLGIWNAVQDLQGANEAIMLIKAPQKDIQRLEHQSGRVVTVL